MIWLMVFMLLLQTSWLGGVNKISRTNELKKQAQAAFKQKDYPKAAAAWQQLLAASAEPDPAVRLNLAHALRLQEQRVKAAREYQQVVRTGPPELRSVAQQQLGNLMAQAGDYVPALELYKAALKSDPQNRQARYNYELLRKYLEKVENGETPPPPKPENQQPQEPNQPQEQSPDDQQTDQQQQQEPQAGDKGNDKEPQEQQPAGQGRQQETPSGKSGGEALGQGENENQEPSEDVMKPKPGGMGLQGTESNETTRLRLQQLNMSPERAKMILDAMRDAEQQYLQQLPRQQRARSRKGKPDW